ncbi:glycoside hydrolase superfamily [Dipodascopsis uninucleata]
MATSLAKINGIYYPVWACTSFPPSELPLSDVTHVYYAFLGVNTDGSVLLVDRYDQSDVTEKMVDSCLRSLASLKKSKYPDLRLLLSAGGGGDRSMNFSSMAAKTSSRKRFAQDLRILVDKYDFDGVDIDWETPTSSAEGHLYLSVLKTIRAFFPKESYLVTSAYTGTEWALRELDLESCAEYVDFLNVMTYDYFGPWNKTSGYHSQLRSVSDLEDTGSRAVELCLDKSFPSNKIVLGIPLYAQGFPGVAGPEEAWNRTDMPSSGIQVAYNKMSKQLLEDAIYNEAYGGVGVYDSLNDIWYSFDNVDSITLKTSYVRENNLAGIFFWQSALDLTGNQSLISLANKFLNVTSS